MLVKQGVISYVKTEEYKINLGKEMRRRKKKKKSSSVKSYNKVESFLIRSAAKNVYGKIAGA